MPASAGQAVVAPPVLLGGDDRNFKRFIKNFGNTPKRVRALPTEPAQRQHAFDHSITADNAVEQRPGDVKGGKKDKAGTARRDESRSPPATTDCYGAIRAE